MVKDLAEINAEKIKKLEEKIKKLYEWVEYHEENFHGRILKRFKEVE